MDLIYKKNIKSELFNIKSVFEEYKEQLRGYYSCAEPPSFEPEIDIALLSSSDDTRILKYTPRPTKGIKFVEKELPPETKHLKSISKYQELKTSSKQTSVFEDNPINRRQYILEFDEDSLKKGDLEPFSDVAITIRVYEPSLFKRADNLSNKAHFQEEFVVLGQNLITELRDKMSCVCKDFHFFDISENPEAPQVEKTSDPNFIFITDTFYNDMRNPNNIDYSKHFLKWSENVAVLKRVKFKVADMASTKFIDLSVYLGFPQVYFHHGNCEHLFVFSHIALLDSNYSLRRSDYPFLRSSRVKYHNSCQICANEVYNYMVLDSDAHVQNPTYLCNKCFLTYHYRDGKKIGRFKAFRFSKN
ncbi:SNAPC3 family protein [Megaselia abdita]